MSLMGLPAIIEELIISALITFVITLIYRFLANQSEIRELKARLKEKQAKIKELQKTNPQEANKLMTETIGLSSSQFRMNRKPIFLTLIVVAIVLPWMGNIFAGIIIKLPFYSSLFKSLLGWLLGSGGLIKPWLAWYMLVSIPIGQLLRKLIGVEM